MSVAVLPAASKTAAPGQYLGFSLQQIRLCYHLLSAPEDALVSLEHVDDTAVHYVGLPPLIEQAKSALTGNPAGNRSVELWKTLANWADLCTSGIIDSTQSRLRYYVTPSKTGTIVASLNAISSKDDIAKGLTAIKALVNKKAPEIGCAPMLAKFLAAGDVICSNIIANFEFRSEQDPLECIRERFRAYIPTDSLEEFCAAVIGMARDRIDKLIRDDKPPAISASQFRSAVRSFVRKYHLAGFLPETLPEPSQSEITAVVDTAPLFVRQLKLVEASPAMMNNAISDYLRAVADKVHWADEGLIVNNSLDELDRQLTRQHGIARDEVEDMHAAHDEAKRGRILYRQCCKTKVDLEGRALPLYFVPGAYNCLADARKLGWHPKYETALPEDD